MNNIQVDSPSIINISNYLYLVDPSDTSLTAESESITDISITIGKI